MKLQEKYDEKLSEIRRQIELLRERLDKHEADQKKQPKNWGFLADLDSVLMNLTEMNRFLK